MPRDPANKLLVFFARLTSPVPNSLTNKGVFPGNISRPSAKLVEVPADQSRVPIDKKKLHAYT